MTGLMEVNLQAREELETKRWMYPTDIRQYPGKSRVVEWQEMLLCGDVSPPVVVSVKAK